MRRTALVLILSTGVLFAHYQFVHYTSSTGPFTAAPEKFDLAALPAHTVQYFVSDKDIDKSALTPVLSLIRQAAGTWSGVETSALRLEFGGLPAAPGTTQSTPGVDVVFGCKGCSIELPPGLIAMGGPVTRSEIVTRDGSSFVPITRSLLVLRNDVFNSPGYPDDAFLTIVHELGHTLGLQHTFTSSAMSTQLTRSTTRAIPLAADDEAGISLLYPAADFAARTGSIAGRVTLDGQGVHLASVVALAPAGAAVSALTDPDGYYKITGLPAGQYYLYVHPLPPQVQKELGPGDIELPLDPAGKPVPPGPLFETTFYPQGRTIQQATVVMVPAGQSVEGHNLAVGPRETQPLSGVTTYSFPGAYAVKPAFINVSNQSRNFLVASGTGLTTNGSPSAGLRVEMFGGSAGVLEDGVKAYPPAPSFLQVFFSFGPFAGAGPRHLFFSLDGAAFVLPAALHMVWSQPPSVASVTPGVNGTAVVAGSNLVESTRVFFDGLAAPVVSQDESNGSLTVLPPPGASGHQAVVTALDNDGQTSMFLDAGALPKYTYGAAQAPTLDAISAVPAGSETMIRITGQNTSFAEGQTVVGFGSSDVLVRRVWVRSPVELVANIHVAAEANQGTLPLTVVSGFQMATRPDALRIQAAQAGVPILDPVLINPATGQPSIYAGGSAVLAVSNLPPGTPSLTLDSTPARITAIEPGRIVFEVPAGLSVGPAILTLGSAPPIVVAIDPPPPVIQAVTVYGFYPISPFWQAAESMELWVAVAGLAEPDAVKDPELVRITLGGVTLTPTVVTPAEGDPNTYILRFWVPPGVETGNSVPLTVAVGYRVSQPFPIPVRPVF